MGDKRRPRPSESSLLEKPSKEYSTPQQARRLWSGTNTRVPEEVELVRLGVGWPCSSALDCSDESMSMVVSSSSLGTLVLVPNSSP